MPCLVFPFQISAVRAVVPNKSNNEIVLVLQHFENCVDKAVHAFLEGMNVTDTVDSCYRWTNVFGLYIVDVECANNSSILI